MHHNVTSFHPKYMNCPLQSISWRPVSILFLLEITAQFHLFTGISLGLSISQTLNYVIDTVPLFWRGSEKLQGQRKMQRKTQRQRKTAEGAKKNALTEKNCWNSLRRSGNPSRIAAWRPFRRFSHVAASRDPRRVAPSAVLRRASAVTAAVLRPLHVDLACSIISLACMLCYEFEPILK